MDCRSHSASLLPAIQLLSAVSPSGLDAAARTTIAPCQKPASLHLTMGADFSSGRVSKNSATSRNGTLPLDETGQVLPRSSPRTTRRGRREGDSAEDRPPKRQRLEGDTALCLPCSKIDFNEVFRKADAHFASTHWVDGKVPYGAFSVRAASAGLYILDLGQRLDQPGTCPLCRFWATVRGKDTKGPYQLCAFSSVTCSSTFNIVMTPAHPIGMLQKAYLAVAPVEPVSFDRSALPSSWQPVYRTPPGGVTATVPPGVWARELEPRVDFGVVKEWLAFCKANHRGPYVLARRQMVTRLAGIPTDRL